jgi:hypothetical protein
VKKKSAVHLQKAVNHTNKVIYRLLQLRDMDGIAINMSLEYADAIRTHLLYTAEINGVQIDERGMPAPNKKSKKK